MASRGLVAGYSLQSLPVRLRQASMRCGVQGERFGLTYTNCSSRFSNGTYGNAEARRRKATWPRLRNRGTRRSGIRT